MTIATMKAFVAKNGLDTNGKKLFNVATPTVSTDGANKGYVDSIVPLNGSYLTPTFATLTGETALRGSYGSGAIYSNFIVGDNAATHNTTGSYNTGCGVNALQLNTTGNQNTAVGNSALQQTLTDSNNTAMGYGALGKIAGGNNTAMGYSALGKIVGGNNTAMGYAAGYSITAGSNNSILGCYTGSAAPISGTGSNFLVLSDGSGTVRQTINSTGAVAFDTSGTSFGTLGTILQSNGSTAPPTWVVGGAMTTTMVVPATSVASATLTASQINKKAIVSTTTAVATYTLPTGTLMDTFFGSYTAVGMGLEWSIINLAAFVLTVVAGVGHTIPVAIGTISAGSLAAPSRGIFRTIKTAANTYTTYRI